ncbi:hypothetical protein O6V14_02975 [Sphingomonas faeni]|uniref:hypothetical protein n=1 Tax=Sphingomonas faeni TaxID=185950 RepID=UPI00334BAD68
MLAAIRRPGVTKEQVQSFRDAAQLVAQGRASVADAAADLEQISTAFAALLKFANQNAAGLGVLVALLSAALALYGILSSNHNSAISHADAQAQLLVSQEQTTIARQQLKASENAELAQQTLEQSHLTTEQELRKLRADVDRLNLLSQQRSLELPPMQAMPTANHLQKPMGPPLSRRNERRRAKTLAKKVH